MNEKKKCKKMEKLFYLSELKKKEKGKVHEIRVRT